MISSTLRINKWQLQQYIYAAYILNVKYYSLLENR